jgi:hypothetical protein
VEFLLTQSPGAGINEYDRGHMSPVTYAVRNGYGGVLDVMFKHALKSQLKEELFMAARHGHADVIKELVRRGLDINSTGFMRQTPLFEAVGSKDVETVKVVLGLGADINARDEKGKSPVFRAVTDENFEMVKFLIANGAKTNVKNREGKSLYQFAKVFNKEDSDIVKLLKRRDSGRRARIFLIVLLIIFVPAGIYARREVKEASIHLAGALSKYFGEVRRSVNTNKDLYTSSSLAGLFVFMPAAVAVTFITLYVCVHVFAIIVNAPIFTGYSGSIPAGIAKFIFFAGGGLAVVFAPFISASNALYGLFYVMINSKKDINEAEKKLAVDFLQRCFGALSVVVFYFMLRNMLGFFVLNFVYAHKYMKVMSEAAAGGSLWMVLFMGVGIFCHVSRRDIVELLQEINR